MSSALTLPPKRYTIFDSIGISFRCAPLAAFLYGFFDLAWAALIPIITFVAARLIDTLVRTVRDHAPLQEVYLTLALLAGLTAFGWLRSEMHNLADLRLVLALRARYRTALTEKRTRLEYRVLEQSETWDLIQRVAANPEGGRLKATYYHLIDMAAFIIKVGGLVIILALAVWWAPLVVIAVVGLVLLTGVRGGKALYQAERQAAEYDRRLEYLGEVLLGRDAAAERTLFGASSMVIGMWRRAFQAALGVRLRARLKWYLNAYTGHIINILIWLLLMLLLLPPLQAGIISVGLYITLTQSFTKFDIVWGFMDTVNGLAADAEFFRDLSDFLALSEEGTSPAAVPAVVAPTATAPALLELRDVCFRYPGTERLVLDGVSLVLEPGKHYALVGANGCGKTTITRLITGLYSVESGLIRINGRDIAGYDRAELRALISIVYQDIARYGVSLRDNVFLGLDMANNRSTADSASEERRIFEQAGLAALVARLPMGADTPLGKYMPGGVDISGGEWQRIAIARSLARPSMLRILDEPTAALDPLAESELYANFDRLTARATTLLITHRLGATKMADVIMVLDGGRIVESGSHNELMRANGLYCRMYSSQRYWYEAS